MKIIDLWADTTDWTIGIGFSMFRDYVTISCLCWHLSISWNTQGEQDENR